MKRKIKLVVIGLALCGSTSFAQESGFGAKLGVNLATVGGDNTDGISMRTSFNLGVYYSYMISDKFGIQPELVFSGQGAKSEFEFTTFDPVTFQLVTKKIEATVKYNYINIPILAKYYFTESLNIVAGPQIGILVSANSEVDGESTDAKEFANGIDFALGVGLAYELELGLNFSARYNIGLSNINSEGDDKNTNNVIQIGVGWQF